jgi:IS5 family transposase
MHAVGIDLPNTTLLEIALKLITPQEFASVIVDSTVQHKAIAHPIDSRLLEIARAKLDEAAWTPGWI